MNRIPWLVEFARRVIAADKHAHTVVMAERYVADGKRKPRR